jgi:hypothetical protein
VTSTFWTLFDAQMPNAAILKNGKKYPEQECSLKILRPWPNVVKNFFVK